MIRRVDGKKVNGWTVKWKGGMTKTGGWILKQF
jgi:hypothetical protein